MSVNTAKHGCETRPILAPTAGNRVQAIEDQRRKKEAKKVIQHIPWKPVAVAGCNQPADVKSSVKKNNSNAGNGRSVRSTSVVRLAKKDGIGSNEAVEVEPRRLKRSSSVVRPAKAVSDGTGSNDDVAPRPLKRCDWITPNSEPVYASFHDKEWGVPVHDDAKLFELLVYSQALAELSWPLILTKRPAFRKLFDEFDPSSVAKFDEDRLLSVRLHGNTLLSEPKLRAIVDNAKHLLKIQQQFGSFNNYLWRFVNNKPVQCGFRYTRQVPAKSPKAELISKDLMQRGFRCVGPTVVYSFMQVAGLVNDHLITCFRYNECSSSSSDSAVVENKKNNPTQQLDKRDDQEDFVHKTSETSA